jgi:hypothetical protein
METWLPTSDDNHVIAFHVHIFCSEYGFKHDLPQLAKFLYLWSTYLNWILSLNRNAGKWWNKCWHEGQRSSIQNPNMSSIKWKRSCICAWLTAYLCLVSTRNVTCAKWWNTCIGAQQLRSFISILPYSRFDINIAQTGKSYVCGKLLPGHVRSSSNIRRHVPLFTQIRQRS